MNRSIAALSLLLLAPLPAHAADSRDQQIAQFAREAVSRPPFQHALWEVVIEHGDGRTIFELNPDRLVVTASNRKLFSSAFVADCLPLTARLVTRFETAGTVRNGVLHGDLIVVGDGDPSFAGRFDPDREAFLAPVVDALKARGIRQIDGKIIADVSQFSADTIPPGWKSGYLSDYYAAPVDALAFNENVVGLNLIVDGCHTSAITLDPDFVPVERQLRCRDHEALRYKVVNGNLLRISGSLVADADKHHAADLVAVNDPALFTAQAIRDVLTRNEIRSAGAGTTREPKRGEVIAELASPELATILPVVLQDSSNLYAEMLHRRAAAELTAEPATLDFALEAERQFLINNVGLKEDEFSFTDASGLSADNMVTGRGILKLLRYVMQPGRGEAWVQLMERPGAAGTLRKRMLPLHDRVVAKTGFIHSVAALSGVLTSKDGEPIFFSIIVNHYDASDTAARIIIDDIVTKLAELY